MEDILAKITQFADEAHGEQQRKYTPDRYIVHPIRVMNTCRNYTDDISVLAAALLHDVLEDTPVTEKDIKTFLRTLMPEEQVVKTISHVVDLTDVYTKSAFPKLNRRARKDKEIERLSKIQPESQTIKYADIIDNSDEIVDHDPDFARVFLMEGRAILKKMNRGDPQLYEMALQSVEAALNKIRK